MRGGPALRAGRRSSQNGRVSLDRSCPSCQHLNAAGAKTCAACGLLLLAGSFGEDRFDDEGSDSLRIDLDTDTVPGVHADGPALPAWFDTPTKPDPAPGSAAEPSPLDLFLRDLNDFPVLHPPDAPEQRLPPGWVRSDPGGFTPQQPHATSGPAAESDRPILTKEMRRAEVRRKRLASMQPAAFIPGLPPDVLVLERNDAVLEALCGLLEGFGFRAHPAHNVEQATQLLVAKRFVAAFLDVAFDGPDQRVGAELCARVKATNGHDHGPASALIVLSTGARPVEKVRATLAGADAFLVKPVGRGDVARAFEACNLPLPIDSRRG